MVTIANMLKLVVLFRINGNKLTYTFFSILPSYRRVNFPEVFKTQLRNIFTPIFLIDPKSLISRTKKTDYVGFEEYHPFSSSFMFKSDYIKHAQP